MNKVVFIVILSVSMCICAPEGQLGAASPTQPTVGKDVKSENQTSPATAKGTSPEPAATPALTSVSSPPTTLAAANNVTQDSKQQAPNTTPSNNASPKADATVPPPPQKDAAANQSKPQNVDGKNETSTTHPNTVPVDNSTKTDNGKKSESAPPKNSTAATPAEEVKPVQARGFDGSSFIGGIILTLGLLAIGFMGFKYYKNQTERNYHTL